MADDPISDVVVDGAQVQKGLFRGYVNERTRVKIPDVASVQAADLAGVFGIDVAGRVFDLDAADTTTAHDGLNVLVDAAGHRFKTHFWISAATPSASDGQNGDFWFKITA